MAGPLCMVPLFFPFPVSDRVMCVVQGSTPSARPTAAGTDRLFPSASLNSVSSIQSRGTLNSMTTQVGSALSSFGCSRDRTHGWDSLTRQASSSTSSAAAAAGKKQKRQQQLPCSGEGRQNNNTFALANNGNAFPKHYIGGL